MWNRIKNVVKVSFSVRNLIVAAALISIGFGAYYTLDYLWKDKESLTISKLKHYQGVVIENEAEHLSSQLISYVSRGNELARSRIFRVSVEGLTSRNKETSENAAEDFLNFVKVSGFSSGRLYEADGKMSASTSMTENIDNPDVDAAVQKVLSSRTPSFSALHLEGEELVADIYIPVFPAYIGTTAAAPERVLVLSIPLNSMLSAFLGAQRSLEHRSRIHLIQQNGEAGEEVLLTYLDTLKLQTVKASFKGIGDISFGLRTDLNRAEKVYSSALLIPVVNWWVMIETDASQIEAIMTDYKIYSILIAMLGVGTVVFFILTVRFIGSAQRYHSKSDSLEKQLVPLKQELSFLRKVSSALPDPVSIKNSESGEYVFCNAAFAEFVEVKPQDLKGLTDNRVFDSAYAEVLGHGDQMVNMSGAPYSQDLTMSVGSREMIVQVNSLPCRIDSGTEGILTVYRDVTSEQTAAAKSIEVRQQVINALVRAVESVPFLDGHTSLMRTMAIEIAETLLLSDAEVATVEAAAILSQVGKTFVPKEIMQKEGKLTPEEILETQKYIEHTCNILEGIKFDLPITQTISQMQETLDGSGYPNKLRGNEITILARILGVTNTFSALVQKRSYRKAKTAHQAVQILQSMADQKYDGAVIEALGNVIETQSGRAILQANNVDI